MPRKRMGAELVGKDGLPPEVRDIVDELSTAMGITRAEFIRKAVIVYIQSIVEPGADHEDRSTEDDSSQSRIHNQSLFTK